jgi:hypothetical protein
MSSPPALQKITMALDQAGVAYMLTGSFASAYYGAPRSTQDIDLVIAATAGQIRVFIEGLPASEYYADLHAALEALQRESMFNVIDLATGWKIDMIIRKARLFSQTEFGRRQLVSVQGLALSIASPEDVIIAKLEWSKRAQLQRQIEDVSAILRMRWEALDQSYLRKWISQLQLEKEWNEALSVAQISESL